MNPQIIIPEIDPLPLPGPVWLFKTLLHLTFVLHLLAMNFLLGGAFIAFVERARARGRPEATRLARWIEKRLPPTMAFTVTLGVAPLLFVQAMYGHLFYSSSVVMAWPWFLVVPSLILLYYIIYWLAFRGDERSGWLRLGSWLLAVGLLGIAFVYVNNMTLAIRPEVWARLHFKDPGGLHGNLGDPTLWPRFLHFLAAALAVAGLTIAWIGARRVEHKVEDGRYLLRTGGHWFLIPTALQFGIGIWFLAALPGNIMLHFMGGSALGTVLLVLSIGLPIGALVLVAMSLRHPTPWRSLNIGGGLIIVTIVVMVFLRDMVRDAMLAEHFPLDSLNVAPQMGIFLLFALLLIAGLLTVAWMLKVFFGSPPVRARSPE